VETTVRGYGGRVDQESSSPEYGSVSFVVPQSKYEEFRAELESFVGSKFLITNISSQNLLPQKLSIEEQQKQANERLSDYKSARQKIVSAHASNVQDLQSKINADEQQLVSLRAETQTPQILMQIQTVSDDLAYLKQRLLNENASYAKQLDNADRNIKNAQDWQKAVETQDKALLDNVATVNGTVSIQFISLWDVIRLYLPGYWIPFIFAVLSFISFLWDRKRFGTV
jgi:chromosome segregation ATPase